MSACKSYIRWVVGFSLLYSLNTVFFYEKWVITSVAVDAVSPYGLALNGSICLSAAIIFLLFRVMKSAYQNRVFWGGAIFYVLGLVFQYLTDQQMQVEGSLLLSGICSGLGLGMLTALWFSAIATLPGKSFAYVLGVGSFISTALGMLVGLLDQPFMLVVGVCFLGASCILLRLCMKNESSAPNDAKKSSPRLRKGAFASQILFPVLSVSILSVVYCVLDAVALQSATIMPEGARLASQLGGFIAASVFLLTVKFDSRFSHTTILNAVFVVLATGLLLLPFTPDPYGVILNVLAAAGWETALLIVFYSVIRYTRENDLEVLPYFGIAYALPRLGFVLGILIFLVIGSSENYAFAQLAIVSFLCLYLIVLVSLFANSYVRKRAEGNLSKTTKLLSQYEKTDQDVFKAACEQVAEEHLLTKREAEVMGYIAQGRDITYISETLFISKNTIKGYRKDIYLKLNVHSRQEVIDLIKATIEEATWGQK